MAITAGFQCDQRFVFFGLATDPRPTVWNGQPMPIGSDLYLSDVNQHWKWTGTAWFCLDEVTGAEEAEVETKESGVLDDILEVLTEIKELTTALVEKE